LARHIQVLPVSATGWLVTFMNSDFPTLTIVGGSLAAALLIAGRKWPMGLLIAGSLLVRTASPALKALSDRPRPDATLIRVTEHLSDPSFPSGHSLGAFALFAVAFVLAGEVPGSKRARTATRGLIVAVVLLVGLCRVLSGAHWPSDVLGGYVWAAVFLLPMIALYEWSERARRPAR
jgi:undecaprenyl-diphosphatase